MSQDNGGDDDDDDDIVSLSKDVFERRMSTGSGLFFIFGLRFCTKLWKIVSIIVKTLRNSNLVASRSFKMKKTALPIGVRCSKRLCLSFLIGTGLSKDVSERSRSTGSENVLHSLGSGFT